MNKFLCGWLSLNGTFYNCDEYGHRALADELEKKLNLKLYDKQNYKTYHGEELLEKLGWVKFTQSEFYKLLKDYPDKGYVFLFTSENKLSKKQTNWILDNINKCSPNQIGMIKKLLEE